jgi:CheY-like chemotaxis protein/HPt (histidine-containing phosphotransfer) domain-containing protein
MRLQQILVNLAGNAIKFTEQGEVVVSIELGARDGDRALLRFEVRDTGIGMTEAQLGQLFNAFSQGDQSITRRFGGTGLGLAITKRLIELMGGQIAVDSEPGQGSRFWFSLPFDVLPDQPEERRKPALGKLRLLVADDNRTSRELIAKLIRAWGWQADEVDSGMAALERHRHALDARHPYDVVLADWHMPGMDGLATAKGIRAASAGLKQPIVVMVNAFARDRIEEISSAPETDVVLLKPITSSNLFDALHQALANQSGVQQQAAANQGIGGMLAGVRLLLVEDNVLNQAVARGILELAGATLDVAADGHEAVELLRQDRHRYDLVLMDMQMPVMDGFTATEVLRQELKLTLPIIAMTAGVLESERERSVAVGITAFIPKPIEVEEMMAVLLRHLPARPPAQAAVVVPVVAAVVAAVVAPVVAPIVAQVPAPAINDMNDLLASMAAAALPAPTPTPTPPQMPTPVPQSVRLVKSPPPAGAATSFNIDSLMRVMGKDAKGRAVMVKMVRGAVETGMQPADLAGAALREGRLRDAARLFHSLRGAVGVLGARRLIDATIAAEDAINEQRDHELDERYQNVRAELERTLAEAGAWLEREHQQS